MSGSRDRLRCVVIPSAQFCVWQFTEQRGFLGKIVPFSHSTWTCERKTKYCTYSLHESAAAPLDLHDRCTRKLSGPSLLHGS